jgi:tetratricopeptide (TPR) repeat protein
MRIHRSPSRLSFRKRRRRAGCASYVLLLGVVASISALTWAWLNRSQPMLAGTNDRLTAARDAFQRGDLDQAIALTRQILAEGFTAAPENYPRAVVLLARALIYRSYGEYNRAADRESALQMTREAVQDSPSNLDITAAYALALAVNGAPGEAADAARRVLDEQPDHTLARTALALAYGAAGSHEVALRESAQAVETAQGDSRLDALRALAIAYGDIGNYELAAQTAEQALALNQNLPLLYFERALYAMQMGNSDDATVAYYQVLTIAPDNIKARLRLCELSSMLREHDNALSYCTEVTERAPSWSDGWYQLGREYFLQGNFAAAQANFHRCSSLQVMQNIPVGERRFECWYLQGQAAQILGDCESLLVTYNEFRAMSADETVLETWVYPPEGPPGCTG